MKRLYTPNISMLKLTYKHQNKMNKQLTTLNSSIGRTFAVLVVAVFALSSMSGVVSAVVAGGQVQYRSIKMSDNGASGNASIPTGVGSGTNVTYRVKFRAASSYTIRGIVLDFCAGTGGTPFVNDATCAAPTGFNVGTTVDTGNYVYSNPAITDTGLDTVNTWTAAPITGMTSQAIAITNATGSALTAGNDYTFSVSGFTNSSTVGTFYARFITYTSTTGSIATYGHAAAGNYQDFGGFALSTAQIVEITAKVQETLTFCVSGTLDPAPYPATTLMPPETCTTTAPPAITLGHGTNNTLDSSQIDKNTVWTLASTNALRGITIRMHNSNICGGLSTDGGTTCAIPAVGAGTAGPINKGVAMFGMFCYDSPTGTLGTANLPIVGASICNSNYNNATNTTFNNEAVTAGANNMYFGMDNSTLDNNVTSLFGDTVAGSTAPVSNVLNRFDFAATASDTTPAGIYKANLAMIATGTF